MLDCCGVRIHHAPVSFIQDPLAFVSCRWHLSTSFLISKILSDEIGAKSFSVPRNIRRECFWRESCINEMKSASIGRAVTHGNQEYFDSPLPLNGMCLIYFIEFFCLLFYCDSNSPSTCSPLPPSPFGCVSKYTHLHTLTYVYINFIFFLSHLIVEGQKKYACNT